jgi:hypothetical protein
MRIVYIDDSGDNTRNVACFAALIIDAAQWYACAAGLQDMRQRMNAKFGIDPQMELHATAFLGGRQPLAAKPIDRPTRVKIAGGIMTIISRLPSVQIIGVSMEYADKDRAFDWLLNRLDTNVRKNGDQALIISDEGKDYNRLLNLKRKNNRIPSAFGDWGSGNLNTSIPIANIVERIWLRPSSQCRFIQAADFCAYSLLRQDEPYPSHTALGINKLYGILEPCLVKEANHKDPQGVVRWVKSP